MYIQHMNVQNTQEFLQLYYENSSFNIIELNESTNISRHVPQCTEDARPRADAPAHTVYGCAWLRDQHQQLPHTTRASSTGKREAFNPQISPTVLPAM